MIYCQNPDCNSKDVKVNSLDFAMVKREGEPSKKSGAYPKQEFHCWKCNSIWYSLDEAFETYYEYKDLVPQTTLTAQTMGPGGSYQSKYIDRDKQSRRYELAKIIYKKYSSYLDLSASDWDKIKRDSEI